MNRVGQTSKPSSTLSKLTSLKDLVVHCGNVAEKELAASGSCTTTFVAVDPTGQMVVIELPAGLDLVFLQTMLRCYCIAFRTERYAVTATMWERPTEPNEAKIETLMVTACSRSEKIVWTRAVNRSSGSPKLGKAKQEMVEGGFLFDLLPPIPVPDPVRALMQKLWKDMYDPILNPTLDRSSDN